MFTSTQAAVEWHEIRTIYYSILYLMCQRGGKYLDDVLFIISVQVTSDIHTCTVDYAEYVCNHAV